MLTNSPQTVWSEVLQHDYIHIEDNNEQRSSDYIHILFVQAWIYCT